MKILQELIMCQNYNELQNLTTKYLGRNYECFRQIDSTQKEIWRRIESTNIKNGMLIRAENQTSGIGTHGRTWISTTNNITFSFYYEMNCNVKKVEGLTVEIAEIILDILKQSYGIQLEIKLPNDIYYQGKKLGGILTESKIVGDMVKYIVVGIGLNNSQMDFDEGLKDIATSIYKEFGIEIDVAGFIEMFCNVFEKAIMRRIGETFWDGLDLSHFGCVAERKK